MKDELKKYLRKYLIIFIVLILFIILIVLLKILKIPTTIFVILSIILVLMFIKIYKEYINYGSKIFKLKTTLNYNELELISKDIEKIDTYQKIIIKDNKIIVINKAGVFEFILFNKNGYVKGNIKDKTWYLGDDKIENPFTIVDKYKYNYFIINGICLFKTDVKLVTKANIYNEISKILNKEVYDNKKIDEIYEVLNGNN